MIRSREIKIFFVFASLFLCFSASSARAHSTLEQYESAKRELGSMKAHFVQKKIFTLFEETETSEGEVWFKRPNQALWSYTSPVPSQTILSGENSWSVMPATKQVQKVNIAGGSSNRIFQILGFGDSKDKLTNSFEVKDLPDEGNLKSLSLTPTDEALKPYYAEIIVQLSPEDYLPRSVILREKSGDITEIHLSDLKVNISVKDSLFEFHVPGGYQLIDYNS